MNKIGSLCVITTDYPSEGRPVYIFVEQLVNALVDKGVKVAVVAPQSITRAVIRHEALLPKEAEHKTLSGNKYFVYRPYVFTFGDGHEILYKLANYYNQNNIKRYISKTKPSILYAHFWNNALLGLGYAMKRNIPLFVACGEGDDAIEVMMASLSAQKLKNLTEVVTGVISVSSENKRKCIDYHLSNNNNTVVLPNAADMNLFYPRKRNEKLRNLLKVKPNDFLILFVGGFIKRKGCRVLAEAISRINDSSIKVIFAGGSWKGENEDPVCEGIVYKGRIEHKDLPDYYAASDLFVLPTLKEGCSNAIIESLAMGVPVVSSIGAFNDDILDESNSIRVNPLDVEEISSAIKKMKEEKLFYDKIKETLVQRAANYSIQSRASKIISFIESQISK
jgi:glycosyltransferase involved in cell wall biosynthesis